MTYIKLKHWLCVWDRSRTMDCACFRVLGYLTGSSEKWHFLVYPKNKSVCVRCPNFIIDFNLKQCQTGLLTEYLILGLIIILSMHSWRWLYMYKLCVCIYKLLCYSFGLIILTLMSKTPGYRKYDCDWKALGRALSVGQTAYKRHSGVEKHFSIIGG